MLLKKPILSKDAPERQGHGGPFLNPDLDFVVANVGRYHILELSMHCIYRPTYILHTRHFAPQTDDLDLDDLRAAYTVMENLGSKVPQMVIYNCGVEAGSSQGHKHMQVFAYPDCFDLFPDRARSTSGACVYCVVFSLMVMVIMNGRFSKLRFEQIFQQM